MSHSLYFVFIPIIRNKLNLYPHRLPVMLDEVMPLYCSYALFVLYVFLLYAMLYWYSI